MCLPTSYAELNFNDKNIWYINPLYNERYYVYPTLYLSNRRHIDLEPIWVEKYTAIVNISFIDVKSHFFNLSKPDSLVIRIIKGCCRKTYNIKIIRIIPKSQSNSDFLYRVVYIDYQSIDWNNPANTVKAAIDAGFNIVNLAFYLRSGAADMAVAWQGLSQEVQLDCISYAHQRGAKVLVSAGGATDESMYGVAADEYAKQVCDWANANNLDGVDYDLEGILPGFLLPGKNADQTYDWFKVLNVTSRSILGEDKIISHAPQAPYLSQIGSQGSWAGSRGGYVEVFNSAAANGGRINFLNVQFYNQGTSNYADYDSIFIKSTSNFPYSSISEVSTLTQSNGIPPNSIVYGTYLQANDGSGFHDPSLIRDYINKANQDLNWAAGTMLWAWNTSGSPTAPQWVNIVYQI